MALGFPPDPRRFADDDLGELRRALADRAVEVVEALLGGPPCERRGSTARWNNRAFSLALAGDRRGLWHCKKAGVGGDLLTLIQRETGRDFPGALAWASDFLGGAWRDDPERRRRREAEDRAARAEDDRRRQELDRVLRGLAPIAGTPAEVYLRGRGLAPKAWPGAVRWSPEARALVFTVTMPDGAPVAVQRVMLDAAGRPLLDGAGRKRKLSLGPVGAGVVRLPGDPAGPLVIAEGGETALAIWSATGRETWACLGAVRPGLDLEAVARERLLVIAADDDAELPIAPSQKAVGDALKAWRLAGRRVVPVWPRAVRRHDKGDFADVLLEDGAEAVRARFAEALRADARTQVRNGMPVAVARAKLGEMMRETIGGLLGAGWGREDETSPPPAALVAASLGLGKTEAGLAEALRLIAEGRGPIVVATPTHKLNGELLGRAREMAARLGIAARVEMRLGREALDPAGDGQARMCLDLDAVRGVEAAGLDAESNVCRQKLKGGGEAFCTHYARCAFQAQRRKAADLWLVSHAALGHTRPREVPEPALVVVDENPTGALLRGVDGSWITLGADELAPVPAGLVGVKAAGWEADRPELVAVRRKLAELAGRVELGTLRRAELEAVGVTAEAARAAAGQAAALLVRPAIVPGMNATERRELLEEAAGNRARLRERALYRALAEFLEDAGAATSGRVLRVIDKRRDGAAVWRVVTLAPVARGWRAPTLVLDATARPEARPLLRAALPGLRDDLGGEVVAATPHLRVTVVQGRNISKAALAASPKLAREVLAWTATRRREMDARTHARTHAPALLVCNAALEEKLAAEGLAAPRVETAHFNAMRGRDAWRASPLAVIAGRPLPSPQDVELLAGALTGRACERRIAPGAWYERETSPLVAGGEVVGEQRRDRHPDPIAEAVRWQACEAEVLQAAGRLRAVNRTAETPAELVLIGCPVPEGLEVHAAEAWEAPGPVETMLALGGVAPLSAPAAARCFPALWPNPRAAEKALERDLGDGSSRHSLMRHSFKGMSGTSPTVAPWRLQPAGAGRRPALALVDLAACPDPAAWLAARLGNLAVCEPVEPDGPRPGSDPDKSRTGEAELVGAVGGAPPVPIPVNAAIEGRVVVQLGALAATATLGVVAPALASSPASIVVAADPVPARGRAWAAARGGGLMAPTVAREGELRSALALLPAPAGPAPARPARTFACTPCSRGRPRRRLSGRAGVSLPLPAQTIRAELRRRGLTLDALARLSGVSRPHLSNALAGRFRLSQDAAGRVQDGLLGLPPPPDDLLAWRAPGAS